MTAAQTMTGRPRATGHQPPPAAAERAPTAQTARALARIEGPRLLRHPAFVAGAALAVLVSVMMVRDNVGGAYQLLMGAGLVPLAAGTLLAANLAALRSLRSDTAELQAALPARPLATTLAHLLSLAWAVAAGVAFVATAFLLTGAGAGTEVDAAGRTAVPSPFELAQGPAAVAASGAAGIALARTVPHLAASALLVVVLLAGDMMLSSQSTQSALAWLAPVVNTAHAPSGVDWPCYRPVGDGCEVIGFRTASAGWHLLYLAGLVGVLAALALARDGERRLARRLGAAGLGVAVVAATLQIP